MINGDPRRGRKGDANKVEMRDLAKSEEMRAYGVPTEAPTEGTEAAENVDGMSEKSGASSRSPTEEIGLRRVPTVRVKRGNGHGKRKAHTSICTIPIM